MPITARSFYQLSDLVVSEDCPSKGVCRETVLVTVGGDTTVTAGTVVFRAKGDTKAAYAPLTNNSQLVAANEFAVLFGDRSGAKESWLLKSTDTGSNAVAFARGAGGLILKDYLIKTKYVPATLTASQFTNGLVHLLKAQGILVETTV